MKIDHPPVKKLASADYVLRVLADDHRQQCQYDPEADLDVVLSFDTTVQEWREACDLIAWRELGRALNGWWGISCTDEQWRRVLEPAKKKKLRGVCELISSQANALEVAPANLLGTSCISAGTFLAIRSLLQAAGASASSIRPSTLLAPFLREYTGVFLKDIIRLAPGALPPIKIHMPIYDSAIWAFAAGLLVSGLGWYLQSVWLSIAGIGVAATSYVIIWVAARCLLPSKVEFGNLETFGDLTRAIVRGRSNQPEN